MANWIRNLWSSVVGKTAYESTSDVILHDPASQGPRDLDDPFFDQEVQARIGREIARAAKDN